MALNNTLIYLHALHVPDFETADLYAFRIAIRKALAIGRVQRLLKRHAWDCNLELEAITFTGLPPRRQIDAQGHDRRSRNEAGEELAGYSPNDADYTTVCDYERCRHECAVSVKTEDLQLDTSTFSVTDARRLILQKQEFVRRLFADQVVLPETVIQDIFGDLPWEIASEALMELLDGRRFRLTRPDGVEGFLVKKAGYLVFQPAAITDTEIPQTMRYARAFQLRRQYLRPSLPVLARGEEPVTEAPLPRPTAAAAAAAATEMKGEVAPSVEAPAAIPMAEPAAVLTSWTAWWTWVNGGGQGPIPSSVSSTLKLWTWLLERYAPVAESRQVALRWWFDRQTPANQRVLLETALVAAEDSTAPAAIQALVATVRSDLFRSKQIVAYRVYNPATSSVEYICRPTASGAAFATCDSKVAAIVDRELNKPPIDPMTSTGPLFGFMALNQKGDVVFKTFDRTVGVKPSSVGAECGNTSNLSVHHPRVRALQAVGRDSELSAFMLPDEAETWDKAAGEARKRTGRPEHMMDISHQPLCLYLEFLTRILDARRVAGKRWFLTAAMAASAGLRGKR
jgi:hypothetical protein